VTREADETGCWSSEQLVLCSDDSVGLRAVIAIDDTTLGSGLGGVRCVSYPSDRAAITEAQRLAAAMTLKNASAQLPYGGAKSVILAPDPGTDREALMLRFGDFVARTGGAYIPGVDMGTTTDDLATIAESGAEVSCSYEDPSPWTALGVAAAIRAAVAHVDRREDLDGVRVLIQGAGHVGASLARDLARDGAWITVADVNQRRAATIATEVSGAMVAPSEVVGTECDVFVPCAVARVISPAVIPHLRCRIVVPAANDTLSDDGDAAQLSASGITYVPDFIANAGGVIHIHALRAGYDNRRLANDIAQIGGRVRELLYDADESANTPLSVAVKRVREQLLTARLRTRDGAPDNQEVLQT
jgi:leucine dehydrogenase